MTGAMVLDLKNKRKNQTLIPRKGSRSRTQGFKLREDSYKKEADPSREYATERLIFMVTATEKEAIRQYQIQHQIRERSEALRRILHKAIPEIKEEL
jgi:hypothetical protein